MSGKEIGMEVSQKAMADLHAQLFGIGQILLDVPLRIDNNGTRVGGIMAVQVLWPSGEIVWSKAYFPVGRMEEVRRLMSSAKDALHIVDQK